jgi:hypothetical protein
LFVSFLLDAKTLPWIFILFYFLNKLKIGAHRESVCERERESNCK